MAAARADGGETVTDKLPRKAVNPPPPKKPKRLSACSPPAYVVSDKISAAKRKFLEVPLTPLFPKKCQKKGTMKIRSDQ